MAVAAACFRAKLAGQPTPAGERTARVLAGYRRTADDRGRGQARPFGVSDLRTDAQAIGEAMKAGITRDPDDGQGKWYRGGLENRDDGEGIV